MIELKNVCYDVNDGDKVIRLIDNICCKFEDNKLIAITGLNGGGKSTLMKLIIGILKPTSGNIFYNGVDITNATIYERAKMGINYAFQQPVTFTGLTVKDLIDIASGQDNSVPKACSYLSRVGICAKEYINREFNKSLSGGEQKRIEIALALAKKGDTIILDEPEAGIDLWSFDKMSKIFEKDKSYIIVSHQEKMLKQADKIYIINDGKIQAQGAPSKVMKLIKNMSCKIMQGGDFNG